MNSFVQGEASLLDAAVAQAGCDDFGSGQWREGFRVLLEALDENTLLSDIGRFAIEQMIVRDLVARLTAEMGFRQFPGSAQVEIKNPLVIVGLPRTGTTALQEMLSLGSRFQGLELWLTRAPQPRPAVERWEDNTAYRACEESIALIRKHQPDLYAIHKMEADKVDECWHLMAQDFAHSSWLAQTSLPAYRQWFDTCDMRPVYERHRRNLQLIGANVPEQRWLLKDSTHLFALDAFLDVYPDACVVQTHRDPVAAIASVCNLCWVARQGLNDGESRAEFGRSMLELWQSAIEKASRARQARNPAQFFDVFFDDFRSDPLATVLEIGERFGVELDPATRAEIAAFSEQNPAPSHRHHLEEWGLEEAEVRERFASYREAYGLA